MRDTQLQFKHQTFSRLPSMPEVLVRLMKELNCENLNPSDIEKTVAYDPALMLRFMKLANSPLCRQHQEITSIGQAVDLLGIKRVKITALSASLQQLGKGNNSLDAGTLCTFWIHSLGCALVSRAIADVISYPEPEEAYVAGMLHDIGRLALLSTGHDEYTACYQEFHMDEPRLVEAEKRIFGTSHEEIGARLLKECNFEPLMVEAILHHHAPSQRIENATELAKILHLSNALSMIASVYDNPALPLANTLFGMKAEDTLKLCLDTQRKVLDLACLLGVPMGQVIQNKARLPVASLNPSHAETVLSKLGQEISHATVLSQAQDSFDTTFDEKQLLTSMLQTACIIFEPQQACFFELDKQTNLLAGKPLAGQADSLRRIRFPLDINKSLLADALLWNAVTKPAGESGNTSMIDEQIIRTMGTRNLLCVPIISNELTFGTLVLAFPNGANLPEAQTGFALAYGNLVANSIQQFRRGSSTPSNAQATGLDEYKLNIRKVVHEINNPLAIMKNYLKVMDIKLSSSLAEPVEEIKVLNEEIDRISNILRRLFTPQETDRATQVDVNALVADVIQLFRKSIDPTSSIKFETRLERNLHPILSDRDSIKQILINLLKNAVEAMGNTGEIIVSTALTEKDGNQHLSFTVSDTGPGVPESLLGKLFEEVNSSKGDGHAGLGLSIVANIASNLGGTISHRPTFGSGATFVVTLPYITQ